MDISSTMADYLMVAAVLDHQASFAGEVWESLPSSWKSIPPIYCTFLPSSLLIRLLCHDAILKENDR